MGLTFIGSIRNLVPLFGQEVLGTVFDGEVFYGFFFGNEKMRFFDGCEELCEVAFASVFLFDDGEAGVEVLVFFEVLKHFFTVIILLMFPGGHEE